MLLKKPKSEKAKKFITLVKYHQEKTGGDILLPLTGKQKEFVSCKKRWVIYSGGKGSGKSLPLAYKAFKFCMLNPGCQILIGTGTLRQLTNVLIRLLLGVIAYFQALYGKPLIASYSRAADNRNILFTNGSKILLESFPHSESWERIKGYTLDAVFLDEGTELAKEVFTESNARLRGSKSKYQQVNICTNPSDLENPLYTDYIVKAGENKNIYVIYSSAKDNPYTPIEFLESMLRDAPDLETILRDFDGEWGVNMKGRIYQGFKRHTHVVTVKQCLKLGLDWPDDESGLFNYYRAVDHGSGPESPLAVAYIAYNGERIIVFDELYEVGLSPTEQVEIIEETYPDITFSDTIIDPSPAGLKLELEKKGIYCTAAEKHVDDGIFEVKKWLSTKSASNKNGMLLVLDHCKNTIMEFGAYKYDKSGKPQKKNDHLMDAIRYFIMTELVETGSLRNIDIE